jgi:hypothetical protein
MDQASSLNQTNNNSQATTNHFLSQITRPQHDAYDWAREVSHALPETYEVNGRHTCLFWLRYYLRIVSVNFSTQPSELRVSSNHLIVRGSNFEYRTYTPKVFTNALNRLDQFMKAHQKGADIERSVIHPLYIEWKARCGQRLYIGDTPGPTRPEDTLNKQNSQPSRPLNPGAAEFVRLSPEAAVFQPSSPQEAGAPTHLDTPTATANTTQPSPAVLNSAFTEVTVPRHADTPCTATGVFQVTSRSAILAGDDDDDDIQRPISTPTIAVEAIQTASEFAFSEHSPNHSEEIQDLTESDQNGDEYHLAGSMLRYIFEHDEQNPAADAIRFVQPSWPPGWSSLGSPSPSPPISAEPSRTESSPEGSSSSSILQVATGTPGAALASEAVRKIHKP